MDGAIKYRQKRIDPYLLRCIYRCKDDASMTHRCDIAFYINDTACRRLHANGLFASCNVNPRNVDLLDDAPPHIETYIAVLSQ